MFATLDACGVTGAAAARLSKEVIRFSTSLIFVFRASLTFALEVSVKAAWSVCSASLYWRVVSAMSSALSGRIALYASVAALNCFTPSLTGLTDGTAIFGAATAGASSCPLAAAATAVVGIGGEVAACVGIGGGAAETSAGVGAGACTTSGLDSIAGACSAASGSVSAAGFAICASASV